MIDVKQVNILEEINSLVWNDHNNRFNDHEKKHISSVYRKTLTESNNMKL